MKALYCLAAFSVLTVASAAADKKPATLPWSYRPPVRSNVPVPKNPERARTAVDRFLLVGLEKQGLSFSPEADRATLLRRVSFDLTGLPPTQDEIDSFLGDQRADAYERMVERCLASPHYGERWGKYWLDAAGYADSNGYFNADSDRPLAYRYRDYVIRSFNQDKPYGRFVREQLAGDEMAGYVPDGDVTPEMVEALTATHFLRNAPDGTGESDGNPDEVRIDRYTVLEGNLHNVMSCLLAVTIQCARCHDHKFEPIRQSEYYGLQAILFPVYNPERWSKPNDRTVTVGTRAQREEHRRLSERVDRQIKALQASLATAAAPLREQLIEERLKHLDAATRSAVLKAVAAAPEKQSAEQKALVQKHVTPLKISDDELAKRFLEFGRLRESVKQAIAEREKDRPAPLGKLAAFVETDANPAKHHVLLRGQHHRPGQEVEPGVPAALSSSGKSYQLAARPAGRISSGRRSALADWITSPQNPLFARIMVNRVWQHHFGVGLVSTPENMGQSGAKPSHPELLDWLAVELAQSGWSVKQLHRLVLTSAAYRQRSAASAEALKVDPQNRLLSHFPLRRLDAEAVRDGLLAVSGELDHSTGGPYVPTRRTAEGNVEIDEARPDAFRRSVYLQQRRTQVPTLLELFDAPAMTSHCSFRNTSTVPLQALALLNSEFIRKRAEAFARRLDREVGPEAGKRIALACRLAWNREATPAEQHAAQKFLAAQRELYAKEKERDRFAWLDLCQMVLAGNAFLYVE